MIQPLVSLVTEPQPVSDINPAQAALDALKASLQANREAKQQVDEATTVDEVEAVPVEAVANVDVPMNEYVVLVKDYSMLELSVDIVGFNNRDVTTVFMSMQAMALKFPDITINTTNGLSEILTAIPYINNNVEGMGEGWPATTGVFSLTDMGNISNTAGYSVMAKISYSMEVLKVSSKQVTVNSAILKEFGITVTKD